MTSDSTLPLEHFIQAFQSQLDNAQTAMAMKARNLNLRLTFAIKDITLDLRAHVDFTRSEIRIRPAGPTDKEASVFHLVFTAITRPMIEENAIAFAEDPQDTSIDELKDELSDEDRKRLEWSGVRTVSKLRELQATGAGRAVERITGLPADRLRRALARSSSPMVHDVLPIGAPSHVGSGSPTDSPSEDDATTADLPTRVRLRGKNLVRGGPPRVTIGGEPVSVLTANDGEIVIAPLAHQLAGELTIATSPDHVTSTAFDLRPFWPTRHGSNGGTP
jgi:hypothetical protein